jgi:hypothetical protein
MYSNWTYQNLWRKICRVKKNPIHLVSNQTYIYWVLGEISVAPHKKFQDLNINKSYFYKSDPIRRNFTEDLETKTYLMSVAV